jgi:tetratricopeptide (TPR) repeat protein
LLEEYLRSDLVRLVTITGEGSVGKTAMTCRLLERLLEDRHHSRTPVELDGVVYLDARRPNVLGVQTLLDDVAGLLMEEEADRIQRWFREANVGLLEKLRELLDALDGRRVVVFIDAAEDLIAENGQELLDPDIQTLVGALLRAPTSPIKLILTSRRPLPETLAEIEPARQRSIDFDEGLPPPYAERLLRDLDRDGTVGLKDASSEELDLARRRTNGNPLALEMLYAILAADRHTTLAEILAETAQLSAAEVVEVFLVRATLSRFDQHERRVLEALAIYQWPVQPEAVDHLLKPYVLGLDSEPILERLVDRQVIRRDHDRYLLPVKYWEAALAGIPVGEPTDRESRVRPPYTQVALLNRGADYFEEAKRSQDTYRGIGDVAAQLIEFDLRLRGGDYELAAHVLLEIDDRYLLRWGHAAEVLTRHQALLDKLEDPRLEQASVGMIGTAYFRLGRNEEAVEYFEQALEIARTLEDQRMREAWITNLGSAYYQLGRVSKARTMYEEALTIARARSDEDAEAWPLSGLCLCLADMGDFQAALENGNRALAIARQAADPRLESLEAEQLATIGSIHAETGEFELAKRRLRSARAQAEGIGYRSLQGHCLADLAEVRLDEGHRREALDLASEALELNTAAGDPKLARHAHYIVGLAHLLGGDLSLARAAAVKAAGYAPTRWSHSAPLLRSIVLLRQGEIEAASLAFQDTIDEADERLETEQSSFIALDAKGVALAGLALCGDQGRITGAVAAFDAARAMTRAKGVTTRVCRLLDVLAPTDEAALLERVREAAGCAAHPG